MGQEAWSNHVRCRVSDHAVSDWECCNGLDDNQGVIYRGRFLVLTGSLPSTETNAYTEPYSVSLPSF